MTDTTLTGFGMAEELDFGPTSANEFGEPTVVPGGISFGRITVGGDGGFNTDDGKSTIEVVNVLLGEGNDILVVEGTLNPANPVDTTGEFTITPDASGNGGTISREGIDWLGLGFLAGQTVQIEGQTGQWLVESIDDAMTPEGQDPNDNSILVLSGDPLPVLTGEITVIGIDALVETTGTFAVTTTGSETRVTRSDGGDWEEDNFIVGQLVRVVGADGEQSVRLIDIEDDGDTLVLENTNFEGTAVLDLELSVQGPHGGLTVLHGGGNTPLELCLDLFGADAAGDTVELTRIDGLDWVSDGYGVGDYVQLEGETGTRLILDIVDADPGLEPDDAFGTWGSGSTLILDGGPLVASGALEDAKIHVAKPVLVETQVEIDLDCCDKGDGIQELTIEGDWAELGFFVGQEVMIEGMPGTSTVLAIDGGTILLQNETFGIPIEGLVTVSGFNPRIDGGILIGGDTFEVLGGAGPDSPLVIYGDTSQDGNWYAGQPYSVLGYDFGEKPFDPFPLLPDGDNEDDEWVMPLANPFDHFGNDVIDASALFADVATADLPSVGITAYGGGGNDLIIGSQAGDHLAGGSGDDLIFGQRGTDHIYGDSGVNVNIFTRALDIATDDRSPLPTVDPSIPSDGTTLEPNPSPVRDSLIAGDDVIFGDGANSTDGGATAPEESFRDIIFGDHGVVLMNVEDPNLPPVPLQRIQTTDLALVTEAIGVGSDNGGNDQIFGGEGRDIIMGGAGDDLIETGQLQNVRDIVFGDNGRVTLNGSETFDGPSDSDISGEEFTRLNFNFDSRPGEATVEGVSGTNDSVSTNGLPAPRSGNWNNLTTPGGLWGNDAGEFITDENGTDIAGLSIGWRIKNTDEPAYFDEDFTDGFGYSPEDYDPAEEIFKTDADYQLDEIYDDNLGRFTAHKEIIPGDDQDQRLYEGYLATIRRETIEIVVEGLDQYYSEYDVYIYMDADNDDSPNGSGARAVRVGSDNPIFIADPRGSHFSDTYIQATSTDLNNPTIGNYVAVGGLTDGRLVIEISAPPGALQGTRPMISGLQIVGKSVPIDRAESVDAEVGGNDAIFTGGGDDIIFGGTGNDWIDAAGDADVGHLDFDAVFGDNGRATFALTERTVTPEGGDIGELRDMQTITVSEEFTFSDIIITGNGDDMVLGGQGDDCIHVGDDGVHNAVDDALSSDDVQAVGFNFVATVDEAFVDGTAGYVASDNWNNLDNRTLGDFFDPSDGLDDENGRKGPEAERFTTSEGVSILVGRDLDNNFPRVGRINDNELIDPDTQNGRLFNGNLWQRRSETLGADITGVEQFTGAGEAYDVYLYIDMDRRLQRFDTDIELIDANGVVHTIASPRGLPFEGELVLYDPLNPIQPANVFVFKDIVGDDFSIRMDGQSGRNLAALAGIQIVSGADKDNVVGQNDVDSDRVIGDQGNIRVLDRVAYEMVSEARGIMDASDQIHGGVDGDVLIGGDGADFLHGDEGDDLLVGDNARVRLFDAEVIQLGVDDRTKNFPSADKDDPDFDPFSITGVQLTANTIGGGDVIEGGRDDDVMFGAAGDDNYVFSGTRLGSDFVVESGTFPDVADPDDDGDGVGGIDVPADLANDTGDVLDFSGFHAGITLELQDVSMQAYSDDVILGDADGSLRLFSSDNIEDVVGSEFRDNIWGNDRNNAILGLRGNDEIATGGGHDFASGGSGNDTIWMGLVASTDGLRDFVIPGADENTLWRHVALGNAGNDRIYLSNGIDLASGDGGSDIILGGGFDGEPGQSSQPGDLLFGENGTDRVEGGRGADTLVGGAGEDLVRGFPEDRRLEADLDPTERDALVEAMLAEFEIATGRSDFFFVSNSDNAIRGKVNPFIDTIPAPEKCPEEMVLLTASSHADASLAESVTIAQATEALEVAKTIWAESGHLSDAEIADLDEVEIKIGNLNGLALAAAIGDTIIVDANAANHGWFVDVRPAENAGFVADSNGVLRAVEGSEAEGRMDILSALTHELGHTLGYDHLIGSDPSHVMNETLDTGTRFDAPSTLVYDERTGQFVDPDTARGLAALPDDDPDTTAEDAGADTVNDTAGMSGAINWLASANGFVSKLTSLLK
ncbi:MAG: hypothetical protein AAGG57_17985 [Pseudomonadota bacterium]